MACMVKADQHSENAQRLQTAGNKVKKAADCLVKAAQSASVFDEQEVGLYFITDMRSYTLLGCTTISASVHYDYHYVLQIVFNYELRIFI